MHHFLEVGGNTVIQKFLKSQDNSKLDHSF